MTITDPLTVYKQRITDLEADRKLRKKRQANIAWLRFALAILIFLALYLHNDINWSYSIIISVVLFAIFLRLLVLSARNNEYIRNLDQLLLVNSQELTIADGSYQQLPDGSAYIPPLHDYAQDLDIFDKGSLYQYANRTTSEQGHETFSGWLLHPANAGTIVQRQEAVKELAPNYLWRQQLHAFGLENMITKNTQQKIERWLNEPLQFAANKWKFARVFFPAVILIAFAFTLLDFLPSPLFYGLAFVFFIISGLISRIVQPVYNELDKIIKEISTLSKSLAWSEGPAFTSEALASLQKEFIYADTNASAEVRALNKILERLELRLNPFLFIFLNTFLFWDLQQVLALEKWKIKNGHHVSDWFNALANFESLSTLATISFNHPHWCFPVLVDTDGTISATDLGHPLIPALKRVTSNFDTKGTPQLALVTGSNMAGKSTFLRSIGVNIVLGMMGAPVCAKKFAMTPMRIISSMRITDNLQENTSTFYAELKKLKYIIEAVNRHETVFLLLDEILRGTNSLDRQIGSKALIRQLIKEKAVGMLATHDLELADMAKTYPSEITNYHFDVQVENEELFFDYKLKEGVCQSLNASILMKKIGIDL